jgi:hypothetical protein
MKISITHHTPSNILRWNALCEKEGNLVQHTLYDKINEVYDYYPVYFEIYDNDTLLAGVKAFLYVNHKLGSISRFISKRMTIPGECIFDTPENCPSLKKTLEESLERFIRHHGISETIISGYYGNTDKLIELPKKYLQTAYLFNTANIDLTNPEETLWNNLHSKHRNVIRKAEKEEVVFFESDDFPLFKKLLMQTYAAQGHKAYNTNFAELLYNSLKTEKHTTIYFAKHGNDVLSGALLIFLGKKVYYAFGGNIHNSLGAGNYLQWRIFQDLKNKGFGLYCLGQVAIAHDEHNQKFSVGISHFKTRFGTFELPAYKHIYIFHPWRNSLFKWLIKMKNTFTSSGILPNNDNYEK